MQTCLRGELVKSHACQLFGLRRGRATFREGALSIYSGECQSKNAYKFSKMLSNREAN